MKKKWIGEIGNTVYSLEMSDSDIFPQGFEVGFKLAGDSFWLSSYSKKTLEQDKKELGKLLDQLTTVYSAICDFEWDETKQRTLSKRLAEMDVTEEPPKKAKAKKASGG